jgi:hypothetical protein
MTKKLNKSACHTSQSSSPTLLAHAFLDSRAPDNELRKQAELLLSPQALVKVLQELSPEEKERFMHKIDEVF